MLFSVLGDFILIIIGSNNDRPSRGNFPPYIHFTLQKTNRDTQDALAYLARTLHVNVKDLSTAGTKDKRGVTVQRVALRRGGKAVEDIWRLANGVPGRHSVEEAVRERGERGVRIADLNYRKAGLELGMLKGNAFVITLRSASISITKSPTHSFFIEQERASRLHGNLG